MKKKAIDFQNGDVIELNRFPLREDAPLYRTDGDAPKLEGSYKIVEVNKPLPEDEDQSVLVDVETPNGVKTVDFMPHQRASIV